jgi:di/tripeptidase
MVIRVPRINQAARNLRIVETKKRVGFIERHFYLGACGQYVFEEIQCFFWQNKRSAHLAAQIGVGVAHLFVGIGSQHRDFAEIHLEINPHHGHAQLVVAGRKQGFIHPVNIVGKTESTSLHLIVRDFSLSGLIDMENYIKSTVDLVLEKFPQSSAEIIVTEQYRNMYEVLKNYPFVSDYAYKAIEQAGLKPIKSFIRGGTDGSRLSFMGLPCPNLFAGEHAFHSLEEWVSVQDMEKSSEMIIHLATIWANH